MKKICILALLLFIGTKIFAQPMGGITITNHSSPCSITVIPIAIAPMEGYDCSCNACALVGNSVIIASGGAAVSYPDYYHFQTGLGWSVGGPLGMSVADFQWTGGQFSYDCSMLMGPISSCAPSGTVGDTGIGCFGSSIGSSWGPTACGSHMFQVIYGPAMGMPLSNVMFDLY